jgi:hypothetical protein
MYTEFLAYFKCNVGKNNLYRMIYIIEIFNNSKSDSVRKENWDLIYRVLREVL